MIPSHFPSKAAALALCVCFSPLQALAGGYTQENLVSDLPGVAKTTDPGLVNPWGISHGPASPFWISDNGTGLSTLYNGAGVKQGLVVTVPPPPGGTPPSAPTGQVFNGNAADFNGDRFIFATEDGTIAGWKGGTNAVIEVDNSASNAVYKGLAIDNTANVLYATDFHNGKIDAFSGNNITPYSPIAPPGGFTDPNLPVGYAPFNIQDIGGTLFVTYALQDAAKHDDVPGAGNGFVDTYDTNGNLIKRLITNGPLNSPWGMALAPSSFGVFGGDLLVGNFGDGRINAFDPSTGAFLGFLADGAGNPIVNQGLWGLTFGNGASEGDANTLYFTAGIPGPDRVEDHGLFGSLSVIPEPGSLPLLAIGALGLCLSLGRHGKPR